MPAKSTRRQTTAPTEKGAREIKPAFKEQEHINGRENTLDHERKKTPPTRYTHLKNSTCSILIDGQYGARIKSFCYKHTELISQQDSSAHAWGSTFWISPQSKWVWPPIAEHDSLPYTTTQKGNTVIAVSQQALGVIITKTFTLHPTHLSITYQLRACEDIDNIAAWEITRVPLKGKVQALIDPKKTFVSQGEWSGERPSQERFDLDLSSSEKLPQKSKLNMTSTCGQIDLNSNGIIFRKRFSPVAQENCAPGESDLQLYIDQVDQYAEIEAQSHKISLRQHQAFNWTTEWYVFDSEHIET